MLSIVVRRSSSGPVFYRQERIGKRGKPFLIYKFRTMYTNTEGETPQLSFEGDPRVTPLGRWLRRYRLDELPQFYNVLRGDMSFVGPRPERQYYIDQLVEHAPITISCTTFCPGLPLGEWCDMGTLLPSKRCSNAYATIGFTTKICR